MKGVINLFKPRGMTSHDAVNLMRKIFKTKKVGHTGTLDPNATGVLPICIGKGTRISEYLLDVDKEYIGELTLGMRTDTQDIDGKVIETSKKEVTRDEIISSMSKYTGDIFQLPPMYSALKHKGKKLYELAREGIVVERKPRKVKIYDLRIKNIQDNRRIIFQTKCSRGTYIRTLCDDIGNDLGTYGYMSFLIRTGVGDFRLEDSYSIEYLRSLTSDELSMLLTPMDKALSHFDEYIVEDNLYSKLINGVVLEVESNEDNNLDNPIKIYCKGEFIGVGRITQRESKIILKMDKVLL